MSQRGERDGVGNGVLSCIGSFGGVVEVVLRAELIAMLVVCFCVDFEGKSLHLSDHKELRGSKHISRKLLS
jgi:hypothetical protein